MNTEDYLNQVAYIGKSDVEGDEESDVYYSKFDGSYITRVGMESNVDFLAEREITSELTHGVGFSPKDNKWYGWSHRANYGFEIGSECRRGSCHYRPTDADDFLIDMVRFWDDDGHVRTWGEHVTNFEDGASGVQISWKYVSDEKKIPNTKLHGTIGGSFQRYPDEYGKGEWTAQTMEDAKQMAIDFNEGVS